MPLLPCCGESLDSFTFLLNIQEYEGTWYNTLLLPVIAYCPCNLQAISTFSELRHPLDLAATPWAVPSQTWILYSRVAPASAVEEIINWNNPPNREASGLVRKGVGQWVIFRAVATPVPTVYPIPSHPILLLSIIGSEKCIVLNFKLYLYQF